MDSTFLHADYNVGSDCMDVQTDLSLRQAYMSKVTFSLAEAHRLTGYTVHKTNGL